VFLNGAWGFDQAIREIRLERAPMVNPTSFAERVAFLASLGAPLIGDAQRDVFVSSGNGAFQKANLGSFVQLEPWGLSYRLNRQEPDPIQVRTRIWQQSHLRRFRGLFNAWVDVEKDKRVKELYGYYANPFILSGNGLQKIRKFLEASDDYSQALKILPQSAEAYSNMAAVAGASGLQELAQVFCRKALAVDSNYAGAWDNLGNVYSLQGAWDDALDAYDRSLSIKPDSPNTKLNRDRAAQSQREGRLGTSQHHDIKGYMDLGVAYYNQQRWVLAEGVFETVLEMGMDTAAVWGDIGVVRAQLGEYPGARTAFEESLKRDGKFIESYKNYALLAIRLGNIGEAKDLLEKGKALQPTQPEICALLTSLENPHPNH
jgi:tetratricopeptide (TPR) repeat protein